MLFYVYLCAYIEKKSLTIMVDRRMPFASTYYNTRNHFLLRRFWPSFLLDMQFMPATIFISSAFFFHFKYIDIYNIYTYRYIYVSFFISLSALVFVVFFGVVIVFAICLLLRWISEYQMGIGKKPTRKYFQQRVEIVCVKCVCNASVAVDAPA